MNKLLSCLAVLGLVVSVNAQDRIELGLGAGTTHPVQGEDFRKAATTGDAQNYWLGYGLDANWGVELGQDNMDFDKVDSKSKVTGLSGVYRFAAQNWVHPIAKLGLTSVETTDSTNVKTTASGGKAALGLEADFKYVSAGALLNFHRADKAEIAQPAVFITLHNALTSEMKSEQAAPQAATAAAPVVKKDSDNDGVVDADDKCQSTPAGVAVNAIGCSETEKASVKLNVEFASGKSVLATKYNTEVENIAAFMKKFPDTSVEIAGHTDNLGAAKANTALSQKRADAVKAALIKAGVEANRVTAKGYGPAQAIADNKTKAGRDQNRRVTAEISVTTDKKK